MIKMFLALVAIGVFTLVLFFHSFTYAFHAKLTIDDNKASEFYQTNPNDPAIIQWKNALQRAINDLDGCFDVYTVMTCQSSIKTVISNCNSHPNTLLACNDSRLPQYPILLEKAKKLLVSKIPEYSANESKLAVLDTSQGPITIELFPNVAPNHVSNFEKLSEFGFYNGTIFHRIVKGFVIQGGDPTTRNSSDVAAWGTGDPGYKIDAEFSGIPHNRGIVSMARASDPNSAGSQFFIVLNDSIFLDNQYTVFGRVVTGMEAVDKIAALPTIQNDQPQDPSMAKINPIRIVDRDATAN